MRKSKDDELKKIINENNNKNVKKKDKEKEKQKQKQVVFKNVLSVIPIRYYDEQIEAFVLKDKSYMDIINIIPRDLSNISNDELKMEMYEFMKMLKVISSDIKLVSMNFPLNLSKQKKLLEYYYNKASDEVRRKWLKREIVELELSEKNVNTLTFYLFIFGKTSKDFLKTKDNVLKYTTSGIKPFANEISRYKKVQVLNKLANMNTTVDLNTLEKEENYE